MKKESIQKRLQKVRPPRVQLTYDVDVGEASELKELPFVVGVLGDFAAQSQAPQGKLRERKFVHVELENFDDVMQALAPRAVYRVPNRLTPAGGELGVELNFTKFADFRPEALVEQVEPLRQLQEARARLADLRNKLAGNDKLEDLLTEVLANTEALQALDTRKPAGDAQ